MDKTLEELVKRAATGNESATTQLLNTYSGVALNWARQMVNDETQAQNIAQNSLIRALSNLRTLQDPSQFEHWLYSIVSSTAASMTGSAAAGMAAAGQAVQGQGVRQPSAARPAQGQGVRQPSAAQPVQGQGMQQPSRMDPGQGDKKNNNGKIAIAVAAAVVIILLCVGGGIFAGRYIGQKEAEDAATEMVAEADDEDIPEEGQADSDEEKADEDEPAENEAETSEEQTQESETDTENDQSTEAETTAESQTSQAPVVIVIEQSAAAAQPYVQPPAATASSGSSSSSSSSSSLDAIANRVLATNGGYVLPQSNSRYYSSSELNALSKDELRVARNEIYARHGRIFDSADLNAYFNKMPWYRGTVSSSSFSDKVFNTYEKKNIEAIQSAEAKK